MLKIIKDTAQNRKIDIEAWKRKYKGVHLGWSFKELDDWVVGLEDEVIKSRVERVLQVFREHK